MSGSNFSNVKAEPLGALFRIDNVLRPGTRKSFEQILGIFNERGVRVMLSATPRWHGHACDDQGYLEVVKRACDSGHVLVAHGVEHRCRVLAPEDHLLAHANREGEFVCRDFERIHGRPIPTQTQAAWLIEARDLLQTLVGHWINCLMPPAHAFSETTLEAMRMVDFSGIGTYGRWESAPYRHGGVVHFPFDFEDYVRHTSDDGSNQDAMLALYRHHLELISDKRGYYAAFIHCDFPGLVPLSSSRASTLRSMLDTIDCMRLPFMDPKTALDRAASNKERK